MQFVCDEYQQRAKWFYVPETQTFLKFWNHGEPDKRIRGWYLPDPDIIRREQKREPSPVTIKLFEYWQQVRDA